MTKKASPLTFDQMVVLLIDHLHLLHARNLAGDDAFHLDRRIDDVFALTLEGNAQKLNRARQLMRDEEALNRARLLFRASRAEA